MVARVIPVEDFDLVVFGGTGDLAKRKIYPALYKRMCAGQFGDGARIIAAARSEHDRSEFVEDVAKAFEEYLPKPLKNPDDIKRFLALLDYVQVDATSDQGWSDLKAKMRPNVVHAFYLSVGPSLFGEIAKRLKANKIALDESRIVVEKPFGHDLASAVELNKQLRASFDEGQIYRIDHYLGKETVQNLMALRFANALFEPLWKAQHIDHVQITVAESISVEGRGGYYDKSGAMRDMVQNHIMQLLCLIGMEPPSHFDPDAVRDEKLKVIRALKPLRLSNTVRGQYAATEKKNDSYHDHAGNEKSRVESFVALKAEISNWRWAGVPFYIRTGKRLAAQLSEIAIVFKTPPHWIFDVQDNLKGNALVIKLQPDEGIEMRMAIKEPGPGGMRLVETDLDMSFAEFRAEESHPDNPDAYERLIMDVVRGNQTLFMRGDEVEAAWAWVDPLIEAWENALEKPELYPQKSQGPELSDNLLIRDGRRWREIK